MKVSDLFGRAELSYPPMWGDIDIQNIVTDSEKATEGSLFLCIKGERFDGHRYVEEAIRKGTKVIVAEQVREACVGGAAATIPWIVLQNTRRVSALLYNAWFGLPTRRLTLVGVTGTNGKTSVSSLIQKLLQASGRPCGLMGTTGIFAPNGERLPDADPERTANMTTPDPERLYGALAWMAQKGATHTVMEVSSHALSQERVAALNFEMGVFTNLTQDHLDFHGTMEQYYLAKRKLFDQCRRGVIFRDSPEGERLCRELPCPLVTASVHKGDFCARNIQSLGMAGSAFDLCIQGEELPLTIKTVGDFSLANALCATAAAMTLGVGAETVAEVLAVDSGVCGRLERVELGADCPFGVFIDYAHTPDALEKLIKTLLPYRKEGGRLFVLFGCGGDRDRSKRPRMGRIASAYADGVILTSDNCRGERAEDILREILRGVDREKPCTVIADRRRAIEYGVMTAKEGDLLVLAGKGHERYEIQGNQRLPFDERAILREAWESRKRRNQQNRQKEESDGSGRRT